MQRMKMNRNEMNKYTTEEEDSESDSEKENHDSSK